MWSELNTYREFIQESIKNTWEVWNEIFNFKESKILELKSDNIELEKILKKFKANDSFSSLYFSENTYEYEIFKKYWIDANQWLWVWKLTLKNLIYSNKNYIKSLNEFKNINEVFAIQNLDHWYYDQFTFPWTEFSKIVYIENKKQFWEKFKEYFKSEEFIVSSYIELWNKNFAIVDWIIYELYIKNWELSNIKKTDIELNGMKIIYWELKKIDSKKKLNEDKSEEKIIELTLMEKLEKIKEVKKGIALNISNQEERIKSYEEEKRLIIISIIWEDNYENSISFFKMKKVLSLNEKKSIINIIWELVEDDKKVIFDYFNKEIDGLEKVIIDIPAFDKFKSWIKFREEIMEKYNY